MAVQIRNIYNNKIAPLLRGRLSETYVFSSPLKCQELEKRLNALNAPIPALDLTRDLIKNLRVVRNNRLNDYGSIPDGFLPNGTSFELKTSCEGRDYGPEDALRVLKRQNYQVINHMLGTDSKSCLVVYDTHAGMTIYLFSLNLGVPCTGINKEGVQCGRKLYLINCEDWSIPTCQSHNP